MRGADPTLDVGSVGRMHDLIIATDRRWVCCRTRSTRSTSATAKTTCARCCRAPPPRRLRSRGFWRRRRRSRRCARWTQKRRALSNERQKSCHADIDADADADAPFSRASEAAHATAQLVAFAALGGVCSCALTLHCAQLIAAGTAAEAAAVLKAHSLLVG